MVMHGEFTIKKGMREREEEDVLCIRCTSAVYCYTTPNGQARNWWQLRAGKEHAADESSPAFFSSLCPDLFVFSGTNDSTMYQN